MRFILYDLLLKSVFFGFWRLFVLDSTSCVPTAGITRTWHGLFIMISQLWADPHSGNWIIFEGQKARLWLLHGAPLSHNQRKD